MNPNFELLRLVLLYLEATQRSPPEPIFIDVSDLAARFDDRAANVRESLLLLEERGFIEGPGPYGANSYIFRKLTRKGRILFDALRDPRDWEAAKTLYLPEERVGRSRKAE